MSVAVEFLRTFYVLCIDQTVIIFKISTGSKNIKSTILENTKKKPSQILEKERNRP